MRARDRPRPRSSRGRIVALARVAKLRTTRPCRPLARGGRRRAPAALAGRCGMLPPAVTATAPPRWASLASFAVPFALGALCAGNGMGFYDSPELAAAGVGVGVTHPPGHPLFV